MAGARSPIVDRPAVPSVYGVPSDRKGFLTWTDVARRLAEARVYWVATSGQGTREGRPRIRPVDGNVVDGVLYLTGSPESSWVRDLMANTQVAVHIDGTADVVILEGDAEHIARAAPGQAERIAAASVAKYPEYGETVDNFRGPGLFAIRPRVVVAWKAFPRDVTRFRFQAGAYPPARRSRS